MARRLVRLLSRHFDCIQNSRDECVGSRAVKFGFGAQGKAVAHDGKRGVAHIVRRSVVAPAHGGEGFGA